MRIILFVNDSYFAYWIAQPVLRRFYSRVEAVVFSNMIKGSLTRIFKVFQKSRWRYILYRISVDIITRYNTRLNRKSVAALSQAYNLPIFVESNVNVSLDLEQYFPCDLGITVNFDQIIRGPLINNFKHGILNFHASRLPYDRGISPVLWAFARGDERIWGTIYQMDEGLDRGPIFKQFEVAVRNTDTAFSLYERVCTEGGKTLVALIDAMETDKVSLPTPQPEHVEGNYWSWPDSSHLRMLKQSDRQLLSVKDIVRAIRA